MVYPFTDFGITTYAHLNPVNPAVLEKEQKTIEVGEHKYKSSDIEKIIFRGFEDIERQEFIARLEQYYKDE